MLNVGLWMPMKPRFALLTLMSLTGCVAATVNSAQLHSTGPVPLQVYEFSGPAGIIAIDPENSQIEVNGKRVGLTSCTNGNFYCYRASEVDFAVIFPKLCSAAEMPKWDAEHISMATVSMFPHTNVAAVTSIGHPSFMLEYRLGYGLVGLWYDPKGVLFGSDRKWSAIPYDQLQQFHYALKNAKVAFACAGSPD